ncbi:MAG: uroporphyrinogen decarboxylase family protein [Promethearchaeota archaeon]|jgi:uroporphyrinogen decarboxylase
MVLSKRERVIRALERDDEPDIIPIHTLGFEPTGTSYQHYIESDEFRECSMYIENDYSKEDYRWGGNITELRFWNVDCHTMDPWRHRMKSTIVEGPPEIPNSYMHPTTGRIFQRVEQVKTGLTYAWYVDGMFHTPQIVHSYWDEYGKPSEHINDDVNYSPKIWDNYVEKLSPYLYPMARLMVAMNEALFEGMTVGRVVYNMRKNPQFIHEVMKEYTKLNLEFVKRYAEAGIDIVFYYDDLGYKGRSMFSLENFRTFMLPYYKKIYQECHKYGIFIIQHSCGYVDKLLPDMVNAGLDCIEALEPAAGVELAHLKETLGDRLSFMGGMDATRTLSFGTPKEVKEEVKRCIHAAAIGGGYFAGPSHNILNVPWENILAFRAAIEKYRKYPLKL